MGHCMDAKTAIDGMVRASGKTPAEIAEAIGRSRTYVYTLMNQGSVPRLDTFARLAHECGYLVILENSRTSETVELYSRADSVIRKSNQRGVPGCITVIDHGSPREISVSGLPYDASEYRTKRDSRDVTVDEAMEEAEAEEMASQLIPGFDDMDVATQESILPLVRLKIAEKRHEKEMEFFNSTDSKPE